MTLSANLINHIEKEIASTIVNLSTVSGGSINNVYCLQTKKGRFLLKLNDSHMYPDMFQLESDGISTIKSTNTISVPDVLFTGEIGDKSYLVLQWINAGPNTQKSSKMLGEQLAQMHRNTSGCFGFDMDNYMGSLKQRNTRHPKWESFFTAEKLQPMVKMAIENEQLNLKDEASFEKIYQKLPDLFPKEPPALIHGDLWSGNYMININEQPYLIDPAVSYSNRECDIALTTLFGGFDPDFYDAYIGNYPLQPGWQQRMDLWNLYPLLIHVNLFGGSYVTQVRRCLAQYI